MGQYGSADDKFAKDLPWKFHEADGFQHVEQKRHGLTAARAIFTHDSWRMFSANQVEPMLLAILLVLKLHSVEAAWIGSYACRKHFCIFQHFADS